MTDDGRPYVTEIQGQFWIKENGKWSKISEEDALKLVESDLKKVELGEI